MASNNNNDDDPRKKKQKTTEVVVDHVDPDLSHESLLSLSAPLVVVVPPVLSLGTVLHEFPDLLFCVLPYIADRVVFNSIAGSNKDMHEKSKALLPPWPDCYELPYSDISSWSPCGTRIACFVSETGITIIDQRRGPFRCWQRIPYTDYLLTDLKFSLDGRYLVSTDNDEFVRLWDTVTGNYALLHKWDMKEEIGEDMPQELKVYQELKVSISACSKYIVVSNRTCVFLKAVENGKTIKSLISPFALENSDSITKSVFSTDGRAVFICCDGMIQVWRPYLDDDDEDRLVTLWRQTDTEYGYAQCTFSHDTKMVAIYGYKRQGTIWSIDMVCNRLTHKSDFPGRNYKGVCFTPDDKYIVHNTRNGPTLRSTADDKSTGSIPALEQRYNNKRKLVVEGVSPNNRQLIVQDSTKEWSSLFVTSFFMKK